MLQIVASLTDNSKECNLFIVQSTAYLSEASVTREKGFINLTPDDDKARLWINPSDPVPTRYSHQVSHGAQEGKYWTITKSFSAEKNYLIKNVLFYRNSFKSFK